MEGSFRSMSHGILALAVAALGVGLVVGGLYVVTEGSASVEVVQTRKACVCCEKGCECGCQCRLEKKCCK